MSRFAAAPLVGLALVLLALGSSVSYAAAGAVGITYDSQRGDAQGQPGIWVMTADGGNQQGFVPGGSESSWSADGSKMIYQVGTTHCTQSSGGHLLIVGADGKNPQPLGPVCGDSRISPDGTKVAYASGADHLAVLSVDNPFSPTELVPVTDFHACGLKLPNDRLTACSFATEPSWLGSDTVVYSDDTGEGGGLWSLPASGSNTPAQIADDNTSGGIDYGISGMAVSPDGSRVVVSVGLPGDTNFNLNVVPVGGTIGARIAFAPVGHNYLYPQWSPDSSTIVFEDDGPNNESTIDTVPATGGQVVVLTPNDLTARNPTFGGALSGPVVDNVSPAMVDIGARPGPSFTIGGSGFTGATEVGFFAGAQSIFHIGSNAFTVNADGTQITTVSISGRGIQKFLHEFLGDHPPYTLDVRVSVGSLTSDANSNDQVIFGGPVVTGVSPNILDVGTQPFPAFSITGTGFTGATSVGFFAFPAEQRVFHIKSNAFTINAAGTQITTDIISARGIQKFLHEFLGDQPVYFLDVRVSVGAVTSETNIHDSLNLNGPIGDNVSPNTLNVGTRPLPPFSLTGSGFTGATSVGFFALGSAQRIFHIESNAFVVNAAGTQITTDSISGRGIQKFLHEFLGDQSVYDLDVRVSVGAVTSVADLLTATARVLFVGPDVQSVSPSSITLGLSPVFIIKGAAFTSATSVGFVIGGKRIFHIGSNAFTVNADGTQITTINIKGQDIQKILHQDVGNQASYTGDIQVSVGAVSSLANTKDQVTFFAP